MPVYEYRCARGHQYERVEGFAAPTEHACPHCGGPSRRRFSVPTVIFKGHGFYSTDNRPDGRPYGPSGASARKDSSFDPSTLLRAGSAQDGSGDNGGASDGASGDSGHSDSESDSKAEAKAAE